MHKKLFIGGRWLDTKTTKEIKNKYSGEVISSVAQAGEAEVHAAVVAAEKAAPVMAAMPAHKRSTLLSRAASLIREHSEELAQLIALECGKAIKFARLEAARAVDTFTIAAEEAKRIHGETVPLDAVTAGEGYFGFWHRKPIGVVAAITPFNFPLNLVAHKVAPAIAAGNSLVLKPAGVTPLTAVMLCEILEEAGLPDGSVNCIPGPGGTVGEWLISDPRVAKVTFTGSPPVGRAITQKAGIKRITLELGNTSPVIVASDADLEWAAKRCVFGAFYCAGQVCISTQRIYAPHQSIGDLSDCLVAEAGKIAVGNPVDEATDVGPMIAESEAERVENWVNEARSGGANLLAGGQREGAVFWPTLLNQVKPEMKVVADEIFGPVASVMPYEDFDDALRQADQTSYGLQAAVFTRDVDRVLRSMDRLNFGGLIINDIPGFRADHMPYGGNRQSGLGREGVRYAIEEMTSIQMVAIRRNN